MKNVTFFILYCIVSLEQFRNASKTLCRFQTSFISTEADTRTHDNYGAEMRGWLPILQSACGEDDGGTLAGNRDGDHTRSCSSFCVTTLRSEHSERVDGGSVASAVVNYQLRGNYGNRYKSRRRAPTRLFAGRDAESSQ